MLALQARLRNCYAVRRTGIEWMTVDRTAIERHLESVLRSSAFTSSRRCQDFLRFVVTETLDGRADSVKERTIGRAVFGRGEKYEPSEDSIVRVKAVEVRKRLALFYDQGTADGLVIELPQGTYVPSFREAVPPEAAPLPVPAAQPARRWPWVAAAAGIAALAAAGLWNLRPPPETDIDRLWKPVVSQNRPVLIAVPSPVVSVLVGSSEKECREWKAGQRKEPPALRLEDLRYREHYWVGLGAVAGAVRFSEILGRKGRPVQFKINPDISFTDLRGQPVLLLGAFTAPWSMEMSRGLRFELSANYEGRGNAIFDTRQPGRKWMRRVGDDPENPSSDYALVSRVFESKSGQMAMIAAGMSPRGTQAAAEFLTDERLFRQFTSQAPADWPSRNFQIVLYCDVHAHTPGPPRVEATHVW